MFNPEIPVTHFIKKAVYHVSPTDMLSDAAVIMQQHDINHLPVCEDERVVGMVTSFDLTRLEHSFTVFNTQESKVYNQQIFQRMIVRDVMSEEVATLPLTATAREAAEKFRNQSFHSLVVVGEDGKKLEGIITVMDLLHYAYDAA